jgi:hypothetical protein
MHAHRERPEWGSVYARNEAMKDIFGRCHEKTAVQVYTMTIMHGHLVTVHVHVYDPLVLLSTFGYPSLPFLHVQNLIHNTN